MRFGARACLVAQDGARFDFQLQQAELPKFTGKLNVCMQIPTLT